MTADETLFKNYRRGIYKCKEDIVRVQLNHAVLVVGYGWKLFGDEYWIIKNTPKWEEKGYLRIIRGQERKNCGITINPIYPIKIRPSNKAPSLKTNDQDFLQIKMMDGGGRNSSVDK